MRTTKTNDATLARRIGALQRAHRQFIDGADGARSPHQRPASKARQGRGSLSGPAPVLTDAIVKMDAELKQLQRRMIRAERPLASSSEAKYTLGHKPCAASLES